MRSSTVMAWQTTSTGGFSMCMILVSLELHESGKSERCPKRQLEGRLSLERR